MVAVIAPLNGRVIQLHFGVLLVLLLHPSADMAHISKVVAVEGLFHIAFHDPVRELSTNQVGLRARRCVSRGIAQV